MDARGPIRGYVRHRQSYGTSRTARGATRGGLPRPPPRARRQSHGTGRFARRAARASPLRATLTTVMVLEQALADFLKRSLPFVDGIDRRAVELGVWKVSQPLSIQAGGS